MRFSLRGSTVQSPMNSFRLLVLAAALLVAAACVGESPTPERDIGATVQAAVA